MSATSSEDYERVSRIPEQMEPKAEGIGHAFGDAVGPKAEDNADRSKAADAVAGVAETAQALADTVAKPKAEGIGHAFGDAVGPKAEDDAVGPKAEDSADRSKAADAVAGVAQTGQALADTVAVNSPALAEYVRGAGQKIDRLASDLRDKKVGDLLTSAAEFGRSQPVIMLAGAALIGFALSRVIKAGVATPTAPAAKDNVSSDNVSHVARSEVY
jgi:hypothetical protein